MTHLDEKPLSLVQAYQQIVGETGKIRYLFRGVYPLLIRAYIVNLVTLPLFDAIKNWFGYEDQE